MQMNNPTEGGGKWATLHGPILDYISLFLLFNTPFDFLLLFLASLLSSGSFAFGNLYSTQKPRSRRLLLVVGPALWMARAKKDAHALLYSL